MLPRLALRRRARRPAPFPLGCPGVSLWYNARVAIWQGVRRLGLGAGDHVLVPAFGCGSEIDALLGAEVSVDCYRLLPDLRPDLGDVARRLGPRTRALYVTHYFGFAQPLDSILAFARERGLLVIEDAAHALYSTDELGRPLGSRCEMSVFSFGKTIPVPDGGALVLAGGRARPLRGEAPDALTVAGTVQSLVEHALLARFPRGTRALQQRVSEPLVRWTKAMIGRASPAAPADPATAYRQKNSLDPARTGWRMSGAAELLLHALLDATIPARRWRNYEFLRQRIEVNGRLRPLFGALPEGCCPLVFPVRVEAAEELERVLAAHGVSTKRFWPYSHPAVRVEEFRFEGDLRRSVVGLPVHQGLGEADMERMAEVVGWWSRQPLQSVRPS